MRRLLVTLWIGLVFCSVCYSIIDRKWKEGDPNYIDFDYHFEEAAKEVVFQDSNNISFTSFTEQTPNDQTNPANVFGNDNWNARWKVWYQATMELHKIKPDQYGKPLCKASKMKDRFIECGESSYGTQVCIGTRNGSIEQCEVYGDTQFLIPICKEKSSNRVITCGVFPTFVCYASEENKPPIEPCHGPFRQICLSGNGSLVQCIQRNILPNREVGSLLKYNTETTALWENWKRPNSELEKKDSENESAALCFSKEADGKLLYCNQSEAYTAACFNVTSRNIAHCNRFTDRVMMVPICSEVSTNRVQSCVKSKKAFLCFTSDDEKKHIQKCEIGGVQICLSMNGLLEICLNSSISGNSNQIVEEVANASNDYKTWDDWWDEWVSNIPVTEEQEDVYLCKPSEESEKLETCGQLLSDTRACVSAKSGEINFCKNLNESDFPVTLCTKESSRGVMACGGRSLICVHGSSKSYFVYYTCNSPSHQLCLTREGLLAKCSDKSIFVTIISRRLRMPIEIMFAEIKEIESSKSYDLMYLCKNENGSLILPCSKSFLYPQACLNTKKGKIQSCERIQRNHNIGLPVCIHVNTTKLVLCEEYSKGDLCFPRSGKMHPLKPCKKKSKNACITAEGKLAKCSKSLRNVTYYYDEEYEPNDLNEMEYKYFDNKQESIKPLCIQRDKAILQECTNAPTIDYACFSSKKGIIHSCDSAKPYNLSICLCLEGPSKIVITCGKFNKVNVCLFPDTNRSTLRPCNKEDHFVCFRNGLIGRCQENDMFYRKNDKYFKNHLEDLKEDKGYQVSGYQNSKRVYEFESRSIQAMLKNCSRLCELDEETHELRSCEDDPCINFACFGVSEGTVKSCNNFSSTELIMPVCVEETTRLVTHGKFFKAYLCFEENGNDVRIQTCSVHNQNICLTKKGFLEKCNHNETGISSNLLEGSQKEEISSSGQSLVKSQFNANIKKTLTAKDNEMFEDNSEEIADGDVTETLKSMLGIISDKKSSRVSKGKQEYKLLSDKDTKEKLKGLENNVKKNRKESKNHGDKTRKHLKKDYDKRKKQEDTKKSNKLKSKPRVEKSINEFNNTLMTDPSMDQLTDFGNEYEYHFQVSNEEENVTYEYYGQDYTDIEENEMLESLCSDCQDIPLEEYRIKSREAIIEKELRIISSIHMISRHLCKMSKDSQKLIDCDSDPQLNFACVGAREGNIKRCNEFEGANIAVPICFQASSRNLVTCDIFSNVKLEFLETDREACLGDDGVPVECENHVSRRSSSMEQFKNPDPNDEKFYRLLCTNCSIQNRFILDGEPNDVLPTLEVFTYPPE